MLIFVLLFLILALQLILMSYFIYKEKKDYNNSDVSFDEDIEEKVRHKDNFKKELVKFNSFVKKNSNSKKQTLFFPKIDICDED